MAYAQAIVVAGDHAFVADGARGLRILDTVADPPSSVQVGQCKTRWYAGDMAVQGDHVYLADQYGLSIVDVQNPAAPALAGFVETPANAARLSRLRANTLTSPAATACVSWYVSDPWKPPPRKATSNCPIMPWMWPWPGPTPMWSITALACACSG